LFFKDKKIKNTLFIGNYLIYRHRDVSGRLQTIKRAICREVQMISKVTKCKFTG